MMWDLMQLYGLRDENCTFVAEGVTRDIENDYREDISRVAWTGINQIKTHRPPPWYDDIIVDVVVETHEDKRFYTEKTWKPFFKFENAINIRLFPICTNNWRSGDFNLDMK